MLGKITLRGAERVVFPQGKLGGCTVISCGVTLNYTTYYLTLRNTGGNRCCVERKWIKRIIRNIPAHCIPIKSPVILPLQCDVIFPYSLGGVGPRVGQVWWRALGQRARVSGAHVRERRLKESWLFLISRRTAGDCNGLGLRMMMESALKMITLS